MSHPADHPYRRGPKAPPTLPDDSQQFEEQVRDLIGELLGLDVDEVPIDASLFEDLGADSLLQHIAHAGVVAARTCCGCFA